jgi:UDP-2,3-diacylglucosamine pyrophosphatase LpxH
MEKKLIFISDLHMNDERSLQKGFYEPYGWLTADGAKALSGFLNYISTCNDVSEVVILGDVLDTWVCPIDVFPQTFESVLIATQNQCVIESFNTIVTKGILLTYVVGNHDMLVSTDVLQKYVPGIRFIGYSDDMKSPGIYSSRKLHGEHGNMYAMFNAPDRKNSLYQNLPLGYFISRIAATKLAKKGLEEIEEILPGREMRDEMDDIIGEVIRKYIDEEGKVESLRMDGFKLPELVVDAICVARGVKEDQKVVLPDTTEVLITTVKKKYANLYRQWVEMYGEDNAIKALLAEIGYLDSAANMILKTGKSNVVLFGHTHKYKLEKGTSHNTIYANTGTWCESSKPYTFVESQIDQEKKLHYIRMMNWKENAPVLMGKMNIPL